MSCFPQAGRELVRSGLLLLLLLFLLVLLLLCWFCCSAGVVALPLFYGCNRSAPTAGGPAPDASMHEKPTDSNAPRLSPQKLRCSKPQHRRSNPASSRGSTQIHDALNIPEASFSPSSATMAGVPINANRDCSNQRKQHPTTDMSRSTLAGNVSSV